MSGQKTMLLLFILGFLWLTETSYAARINATSCSKSDIQAAIDSSATGDTILIPSGSCTWSSQVSIPNSKKITLQGAGYTSTRITRAGTAINMGESGSRLTGIEFVLPSGSGPSVVVQGTGWRIDHCRFDNETGTSNESINVTGVNRSTLPEGLIDNNVFDEGRVVMNGMGSFEKCCIEWASDSRLGTGNNVFIEDNIFYKTVNGGGNVIDANRAASYVARFNTVGGKTEFMAHSLQSDNERATRNWEVYGNTFDSTPVYTAIWMRGGTGFIWNNTIDPDYTCDIIFDNVRCFNDVGDANYCDGNSDWDENTPGQSGWACRDQIGRGSDESLWTDKNPYPSQPSQPAYLWLNRTSGSISSISIANDCENWIQSDRDYYNEVSSFDGTSGVGVGTLAERPSTCTTGVAYWATDQGDWNKRGADGVLYKCTSTNTWELYYTPYTYPHPLQGPSPPQNLEITN